MYIINHILFRLANSNNVIVRTRHFHRIRHFLLSFRFHRYWNLKVIEIRLILQLFDSRQHFCIHEIFYNEGY